MNNEIIIYSPEVLIKYKIRVDVLMDAYYERFESEITDSVNPNIEFQTKENQLSNGKARFNLVSEYTINNLEIKRKFLKSLSNMYITITLTDGLEINEINKHEIDVVSYIITSSELSLDRYGHDKLTLHIDKYPFKYEISNWKGERLYITDNEDRMYNYKINNEIYTMGIKERILS